jgi:hypothetical protein
MVALLRARLPPLTLLLAPPDGGWQRSLSHRLRR